MSIATSAPTASLEAAFQDSFPSSFAHYQKALDYFPNGVTHDGRYMKPFPVYIDRADGAHKWDVDGHELIDYWMGHGALLLGHGRKEVVDAVMEQAARGMHYGACHELEIKWADLVSRLVPAAERVRFVSSGTEATLMAIRLARTYTGRRKVVKFKGHYHGWHDNVMDGIGPDQPLPGVLNEVFETLITLPPNDLNHVEETLKADHDVACLILEPTGELFGGTPLDSGFLDGLRELTTRYGVVFILDEVVTGFRCAPGGAQAHYGIVPDLCTLAKVLAGGMNGGAVVGKKDIMDILEIRTDPEWQRNMKMPHYGTFNASPLSAAAGIAALEIVETGKDITIANDLAELLRNQLSEVLRSHKLDEWHVYGAFSGIKISYTQDRSVSRRGNLDLIHSIRQGWLLNGVDMSGVDGLTSSAHTPGDVVHTAEAFDATLTSLKRDHLI